jgi:spore maturation protein CgeB
MKLHILAPSDTSGKVAHLWQDYWVKKELEDEFRNLGYVIVNSGADIDLYLFGTWSPHERFLSAPNRFMWFYSHPRLLVEKKWEKFHRQFKHIWTISKPLFVKKESFVEVPISVLIGGTSKTYVSPTKEPEYDVVLMGNTSKPRRVGLMKELISQNKYKIMIAGGGWNKRLTPEELNKITYVSYFPNEKYSEFYNNGKVTFFAGHPDMLEYEMIPPRVYDIYACSDCLCICELNGGLKYISSWISNFAYDNEFLWKVHYYIKNRDEALTLSKKSREGVMQHTFKIVANQMHQEMKKCRV